jgi:thymidylate synthase (FAD)
MAHAGGEQPPGQRGGGRPDRLGERFHRTGDRTARPGPTHLQRTLDAGVAREQARKDLPLATYTEAYWKVDLHNLLHFLFLRMDSHAQYEIRAYAERHRTRDR